MRVLGFFVIVLTLQAHAQSNQNWSYHGDNIVEQVPATQEPSLASGLQFGRPSEGFQTGQPIDGGTLDFPPLPPSGGPISGIYYRPASVGQAAGGTNDSATIGAPIFSAGTILLPASEPRPGTAPRQEMAPQLQVDVLPTSGYAPPEPAPELGAGTRSPATIR